MGAFVNLRERTGERTSGPRNVARAKSLWQNESIGECFIVLSEPGFCASEP